MGEIGAATAAAPEPARSRTSHAGPCGLPHECVELIFDCLDEASRASASCAHPQLRAALQRPAAAHALAVRATLERRLADDSRGHRQARILAPFAAQGEHIQALSVGRPTRLEQAPTWRQYRRSLPSFTQLRRLDITLAAPNIAEALPSWLPPQLEELGLTMGWRPAKRRAAVAQGKAARQASVGTAAEHAPPAMASPANTDMATDTAAAAAAAAGLLGAALPPSLRQLSVALHDQPHMLAVAHRIVRCIAAPLDRLSLTLDCQEAWAGRPRTLGDAVPVAELIRAVPPGVADLDLQLGVVDDDRTLVGGDAIWAVPQGTLSWSQLTRLSLRMDRLYDPFIFAALDDLPASLAALTLVFAPQANVFRCLEACSCASMQAFWPPSWPDGLRRLTLVGLGFSGGEELAACAAQLPLAALEELVLAHLWGNEDGHLYGAPRSVGAVKDYFTTRAAGLRVEVPDDLELHDFFEHLDD